MQQIAILDWLVDERLPLVVEKAVVQIDGCLADEVVSEDVVVVHHVDVEGHGAGERCFKLVRFEEFRLRRVQLVIITLVDLR